MKPVYICRLSVYYGQDRDDQLRPVTQRTREIGIRIALGADRAHVLGLVTRTALSLAAVGILLGVTVSLGATRLLRSLLYGTSATDPAVFALGVVVLLLGVAAAALIPARRATAIDPMTALRAE
jgi:ABC-type antimicrobial peptide transport system permease subunit